MIRMAFACQRNSYLKELLCTVISCVSVGENNYEVVLNDTVFFPEGGGQPDDRGKIGEVDIQRVLRRGSEAIHYTKHPVTVGEQYQCSVDWKRRKDHMQQHSRRVTIDSKRVFLDTDICDDSQEKSTFQDVDVKVQVSIYFLQSLNYDLVLKLYLDGIINLLSSQLARGKTSILEEHNTVRNVTKQVLKREMGTSMSHVELSTSKITQEQIDAIETECNEKIRQRRPVSVHYLTKAEAMQLQEVGIWRSKDIDVKIQVESGGLPDDVAEPIRVIEIQDIEKNMCCGTHVENLSELQVNCDDPWEKDAFQDVDVKFQAIKLLHTEAMRGGTRVYFITGDRLLRKLTDIYEVERKMTKLLSCGLDEHVDSVEKLKANLRVNLKANRGYLKELAKFEAEEHAKLAADKGYIFKHREDGDMDYIYAFLNSVPNKDLPVFVCGGAVKTGGQFVLRGNDETIKELSPSILELIDGKGGGKKGQLQGKASSFKKLKDVEQLLQGIAKPNK